MSPCFHEGITESNNIFSKERSPTPHPGKRHNKAYISAGFEPQKTTRKEGYSFK